MQLTKQYKKAHYTNAQRGYVNNKKGEIGEKIAEIALKEYGIKMIEKVHTPWKVIRSGKKIIGAFPLKKVSGDFIGIEGNGRKVLAEVKVRDLKLSYSDFDTHQILALDTNAEHGGLSLVVWICGVYCYIIKWIEINISKNNPKSANEITGILYKYKFN